jgi:PAS domain S-box-containing protein
MLLFSFAYIFVGSICFTLGFLHLLIFLRRRDLKVDLVFSFLAFAISLSTFFELWAFKTQTLSSYIPLLKATLTVQALLWIAFVWFVYFFTRATRLWPPLLVSGLYTLALIINLLSPFGILFSEITELTSFSMANGEIIHFANGHANTFRIVADLAWIIFLVYAAFATIVFGRTGNTRKAAIFGVAVFLCIGFGYLHGTLIDIGYADPPYLGSFLFLPLSLVMSYSLAGDVIKASRLNREIKMAELRWRNLLENVNLCVLGVNSDKTVSYINPFFLQLTGYDIHEVLGHSIDKLFPENEYRSLLVRFEQVIEGETTISKERHLAVLTRSGERREIIWSNVLLADTNDHPYGTLSIGRDITVQTHAEAARDLAIQELEAFKRKLEEENFSLKELIQADHGFQEIIGESNGLLYILSRVQQVAQTDSTVLILGETGTGKELVAQAIHQSSQRREKPFVRVNCAAIPADLVESELFGHEPGSFTNAINLRRGKFELAEGGTIFLDEISEMPLIAQAKLLNVLQENEVERIGGTGTIPVNVRVISATNRDLNIEVCEGRFRSDLFYRLNVYPLTLPPLRNRKDDIPLLVKHFISIFNKTFGKQVKEVPSITMDALMKYDWPGNIRELKNILERAMITCIGSNLTLPPEFSIGHNNGSISATQEVALLLPLEELERQHILRVLQHTNWQIGGLDGAARVLRINPSTLRSRIKKLGLKKP